MVLCPKKTYFSKNPKRQNRSFSDFMFTSSGHTRRCMKNKYPLSRRSMAYRFTLELPFYNFYFVTIADGHSTETMKFVWSDGAVTLADNIEFPQFSVKKIEPYMCEKDYYGSKQVNYYYFFYIFSLL